MRDARRIDSVTPETTLCLQEFDRRVGAGHIEMAQTTHRSRSLAVSQHEPAKAQNSWRQAVACTVSIGMLAMHLPLAALAQAGPTPPDDPVCCSSCEGETGDVEAVTERSAEQTSSWECTSAQGGEHGPDVDRCCPDGCRHCDLPCCGSMPLALVHATDTVARQVTVTIAPATDASPPSMDPQRIFRPPRC